MRGVGSFAVVPLDVMGRRIGLLVVADRRVDRPTIETIEHLELLGALAAASLRTHEVLADVRELAAQDALTGLGHHGSFYTDVDHAVRAGTEDRPCVVLVDLDLFKDVNDLHGHPAGDDVLRRTAGVLSNELRGSGDRAYRVGGDEFAVLMRVTAETEATALVGRLHAALTDLMAPLTVSIGYALRHPGEDAAMLVARADQALYEVKRTGRAGTGAAPDPHPVSHSGAVHHAR